jgi:hypothetical protein
MNKEKKTMTKLTEVILTFSPDDRGRGNLKKINKWLKKHTGEQFGPNAAKVAGGELVSKIYIGAFEGLDLNKFVDYVGSLDFTQPTNVQLFTKTNTGRFGVVFPCMLEKGKADK